MKEKIMNIKNILRIIISLFVIFSMVKSCAKAYTFDDFVYFIQTNQTKLNEIGGNWKNTANFYSSGTGYTKAKAYFNDEDFQGFAIGNSTSYYLMALNNQTSISVYGTNQVQTSGGQYKRIDTYSYNPSSPSYGTGNGGVGGTRVILISGFPNFNYPSSVLSVNEYTPQNPFYFGHLFSQNYNYNNEVIQACELNYNYRIQFIENVITESYEVTNITATLDDITLESTDLGSYWTLKCTNSTLLKYDKIYTLNVEITTTSNTYELSEQILFVPPGTLIESGVIVNYPSGDYSFNTENATNQIIENQDKNNNFWENAYNELFVMESGDVQDIIDEMKANIKIDDIGDMSGEIAILNTLTGEPSDFIIAWNPTSYMGKVIIPSGEINFSQKVREVPALQTTQNWLRIIMGYSVSIVLLSEIFFTILKVLGVSVSIYDQHNEEIERLEEMHRPKIYDTEVITPKGIKRYKTRRTRIQ